jgi:hypothetical protein
MLSPRIRTLPPVSEIAEASGVKFIEFMHLAWPNLESFRLRKHAVADSSYTNTVQALLGAMLEEEEHALVVSISRGQSLVRLSITSSRDKKTSAA